MIIYYIITYFQGSKEMNQPQMNRNTFVNDSKGNETQGKNITVERFENVH